MGECFVPWFVFLSAFSESVMAVFPGRKLSLDLIVVGIGVSR